MTNSKSGEPGAGNISGTDAEGRAVPTAAAPAGPRWPIVVGAVIVAVTVAGGALSLVGGMHPAWHSFVATVSPGPPPKILLWRDAEGAIRKAAVDPVKYEELVTRQRLTLDAARIDTRADARTRIEADTSAGFSDIDDRLPQIG